MLDALLDLATVSPWAYLAIVAVTALDAVLPVLPSEATVISAGALAGSGELAFGIVLAAAALGAVVGDNGAYLLGRLLGPRALRGEKGSRARAWAEEKLRARAGALILVSRFLPGGRTATTMTAGLTRMRWTRFARLTSAAGLLWASYVVLLGFAGGAAFEDRPYLGCALGLCLGLAGTALLPLYLRARRRATR
jgi:membrane-associated protein